MKPDKRVLRQLARLYAIAVDDVIEFRRMKDLFDIIQNLPNYRTFTASRRSSQTDDAGMLKTQSIIQFRNRKVASSHLCQGLEQ